MWKSSPKNLGNSPCCAQPEPRAAEIPGMLSTPDLMGLQELLNLPGRVQESEIWVVRHLFVIGPLRVFVPIQKVLSVRIVGFIWVTGLV
ncbi:hypothetical protein DEO72_LG9g1102 [Vigna unguiculata]|uniref:Uncharacterized protein n=1 Tax=Vigna unguiculata TaxID=3917 RepID=A0A4D6MZR2_VIGUN|nr:hypothetical protein DEO72_LG9g1102 [Vigna unguiculata]